MSIKVLTIINPTSGKGNILDKVDEIKKNIEEQGMEVDIKFTKKDYNARKIIENYEQEKGLIERKNSKKNGEWTVKLD